MRYLFASSRGPDFESEGNSSQDAYRKLLEKEKYSGTLWRLSDPHRLKFAIKHQGFKLLAEANNQVAFKELG